MFEPESTVCEPVVLAPFVSIPELIPASAIPALDEKGNPIYDQEGRQVYG